MTKQNQPHILLFNTEPDTDKFIREALTNEPCVTHSVSVQTISNLDMSIEYSLIFAEVDFDDQTMLQHIFKLRNSMSRCMTIFILHEPNQEHIKNSYIIGDGSIVFPIDLEKFHRIIRWYISTGETRQFEILKEKHRHSKRNVLNFIKSNKGLLLALLFLTLLFGAFVGIFCADFTEKSSAKENQSFEEKIKGALHELQK